MEGWGRNTADRMALVWGVLLLIAAWILLSEILDFVLTGTWHNLSLMDFVDMLTDDDAEPAVRLAFLGLPQMLRLIPALPVFLLSGLLAFFWKPSGNPCDRDQGG